MRGKPVGKVPDIRGATGNSVLLFQLMPIGKFVNLGVFIRTLLGVIAAAAADIPGFRCKRCLRLYLQMAVHPNANQLSE
jgi:hypothetical protein